MLNEIINKFISDMAHKKDEILMEMCCKHGIVSLDEIYFDDELLPKIVVVRKKSTDEPIGAIQMDNDINYDFDNNKATQTFKYTIV